MNVYFAFADVFSGWALSLGGFNESLCPVNGIVKVYIFIENMAYTI